MKTIENLVGESIYGFFERVLVHLNNTGAQCCHAEYDDTAICVYQASYITDLCEKWHLQKRIDTAKDDGK